MIKHAIDLVRHYRLEDIPGIAVVIIADKPGLRRWWGICTILS